MKNSTKNTISWADFQKIDMRVGTIIAVDAFHEARNPAYKLQVDFGDLGIRKSSAQITDKYTKEDLVGRQVIAIVNFPPKQIATMMSECLVMGAVDKENVVTLIGPESPVINGLQIG